MCNLSQGVRQKGRVEVRFEERLESIRALMETAGISSEQAMDMLKVKEQDRPEVRKALGGAIRSASSAVVEEVPVMCNLSQGICQKAYAEGYAEGRFEVRLESIRALIETVGASSEQAMDLLEIKEQDRPEIREALASSGC